MPDSPRPSVQRLAESIEAYLARWPRAADTEQGIADWWLREDGIVASADEVACALDLLLARGVVRSISLPDGTRIYASAAAVTDDRPDELAAGRLALPIRHGSDGTT